MSGLILPAGRPPTRAQLDAVLAVEPVALAAALSTLHDLDPLAVAARVGIEVADLRRDWRYALVDASREVAGALDWRRLAVEHIPIDELRRRRFPPDGDRDRWVRSGASGAHIDGPRASAS